jgi:membrane-bound lytic murein transglycosylase D
LALAELVKNPEKFNLEFSEISNTPFLKRVPVDSQIDLALAADLAEISIEDIYRYNAAFNRWATDPNGPHFLLLPVQNAKIFETKLKQLKPENRIKWVRYTIKSGDSVSTIARKFRTSKALIRSVNNIRNNKIRAGKTLTIPSATKSLKKYTLSADRRLKKITSRPRQGTKIYHRVVLGDSMWDISRKYKVNLRALAKWNGMAPTDKLKVGKKLVVWVKSNSAKAIITSAPSKTRKIHYKVRNGDSLARISDKFQVKMKDLMRWNKLNPKKYLQPGQSLTLFIDVLNQTSR